MTPVKLRPPAIARHERAGISRGENPNALNQEVFAQNNSALGCLT